MADCPDQMAGVSPFEAFVRQAHVKRVPVNASLELTRRCNLRCVHCYTGPGLGATGPDAEPELTTPEWHRILEELAEAGCLMVLITGGEPLLRPDFCEIYRHARELGFVVNVFTNATLIDDETANFLRSMPPRTVDVTLYGATAETYERITRKRGSFEQCMQGIEALRRAGVRVTLKSILMTLNEHEFEAIEKLARSLGDGFRLDAALTPRYGGDREPLRYRVAPEVAVEHEFAAEDRRRGWTDLLDKPPVKTDGRLFACGAGRRSCHVNAFGKLLTCLADQDEFGYDLRHRSFREGWETALRARVAQRMPDGFLCDSCSQRRWCGQCPLYVQMETCGNPSSTSWACRLGDLRLQRARKERSCAS